MKTRKQTLKQAIDLVRSGRGLKDVTRSGLSGCPAGGWAETVQAKHRMVDALPHASARSYTLDQIVDALYEVDAAGRYQYRS